MFFGMLSIVLASPKTLVEITVFVHSLGTFNHTWRDKFTITRSEAFQKSLHQGNSQSLSLVSQLAGHNLSFISGGGCHPAILGFGEEVHCIRHMGGLNQKIIYKMRHWTSLLLPYTSTPLLEPQSSMSTAGHLLTTTGLPPSMDSTFYPTAALLSYGWVQQVA
jgi:hypothetical protein